MTRCAPGCGLCNELVAEPHYCVAAIERAHARWLEGNRRYRAATGLDDPPLASTERPEPRAGYVDLQLWGAWRFARANHLPTDALDERAARRVERAVARLAAEHRDTLLAAYTSGLDVERVRPKKHGRRQKGPTLPPELALAERAYVEQFAQPRVIITARRTDPFPASP